MLIHRVVQNDNGKRQKKKRGLKLRLRYLRYRQTPLPHIRVKAHALRREHQLLLLCDPLNFADFQEQEYKANASYLYVFSCC